MFTSIKLNDCGGDLTKSWFLHFTFTDPESGESIRIRRYISRRIKSGSARREKAHLMKQDLRKRMMSGWNPITQGYQGATQLLIALERLLQVKQTSVRPRSFQAYQMAVKHLDTYLRSVRKPHLAVDEFSPHTALQFMDWRKVKGKISNRTYNKNVGYYRTLWNDLIERDYILENPFNKVRRLPEEETTMVTFSGQDLARIIRFLPQDNPGLFLIAQLIFSTYLRPAEVCKLQRKHFDFETKRLTIPGSVSKSRKEDILLLPDAVIDALMNVDLHNKPADYYIVGWRLLPGKTPTHPNRIHEAWRRWCEKNKVSGTIYNLKHNGCGMAAQQGVNVRDLQLHLRHHSLEMTQRYLERFSRTASLDSIQKMPTL